MLPVEFFRQPWLGVLCEGERAGTDKQVERGDAGLRAPPGALRTFGPIHLSVLLGPCPVRDQLLCPDLLGPQRLRMSAGFYLPVIQIGRAHV